jgi:TPR repeat protein
VQSQPQQSPTTVPPAANTKATPDANTETANAEPAKPIEAPVPKASTKPQPGQQELAKAMDASDPAAAAAWLWKATSRGNPVAPVRLADMYIRGQGVPRSCEQALVLLRSAATKENAPARNRLAALYANGTCVARDRVKAYQLMSSALAADPTSDWAQQNRQTLWNEMTAQERAEAQKYR